MQPGRILICTSEKEQKQYVELTFAILDSDFLDCNLFIVAKHSNVLYYQFHFCRIVAVSSPSSEG